MLHLLDSDLSIKVYDTSATCVLPHMANRCGRSRYSSFRRKLSACIASTFLIISFGCHAAQDTTPKQKQTEDSSTETSAIHNKVHVYIGDGYQTIAGTSTLAQLALNEIAVPPSSLPPLPPDIAVSELQPRAFDDPRAFLSLVDAVQFVTAETGFMIEPHEFKPITDADAKEAVLLYLDARAMYLDGHYFDAVKRAEHSNLIPIVLI